MNRSHLQVRVSRKTAEAVDICSFELVSYRDLLLTPDEQAANDQFLPCCSRSKSGVLVLDL
jgi:hypothetical protein